MNTTEKVSKKDLARKFRHEAYLKAKEFRRTDPKQIAMAEKMKERRKEVYQAAKERNKVYRAGIKKGGEERAGKKKTVRQDKLKAMGVRGNEIPFEVRRLKV
jgi:4-hydroxy-3-methylbut-2-en-1-yl diphosphate synthase IspG/GcpE